MNGNVVLVTGAGGCIAAWAMADLLADGAEVVAFDISENKRRVGLVLPPEEIPRIRWEVGDIADGERLKAVVQDHDVRAIIHLAALQVPFCKSDPVAGARVNVVGTVNVFEAARAFGIKRLTYASSIAVQGMGEGSPWLATLYGAHKACGEAMAAVYWQDWQVPSIGIRPGVVYGPGRDQGMSAAPTVAMLAAVAETNYEIPFTGPFPFLYVREAASAFVRAVADDRSGAGVFDLNGVPSTIEEVMALIGREVSGARISCRGSRFPFPDDIGDAALGEAIGPYRKWSLEEGVKDTLERFHSLVAAGKLGLADVR
jgi:nucleoside-diphosphate-sugar epimerase